MKWRRAAEKLLLFGIHQCFLQVLIHACVFRCFMDTLKERCRNEIGYKAIIQHLWSGNLILLLIFSCSVVSDSSQPHGLQHTRLPCPSPSPRVCSNSCPLDPWCHPIISFSVTPFSSCLQSFPAPGSFLTSQFFASDSQRTGASASTSVLPMNIQDWFPLRWTGWISLLSKGCSRVRVI